MQPHFDEQRSAIDEQLTTWAFGGDVGALRSVKGLDPVLLLRRALLKCPDDYPPPSTADPLALIRFDPVCAHL